MKGNEIILTNNPQGDFLEGIISGTPKPGTCMQIQAGTAPKGGRHTYEAYNPTADTDPRNIMVLLPDWRQGKTATDAYVSGTRGFLYCPLPGDELNMLVKDLVGTADTHTIGERYTVEHGSGKLITQGTSANAAPFTGMEATAGLAADSLVWVMRNVF